MHKYTLKVNLISVHLIKVHSAPIIFKIPILRAAHTKISRVRHYLRMIKFGNAYRTNQSLNFPREIRRPRFKELAKLFLDSPPFAADEKKEEAKM